MELGYVAPIVKDEAKLVQLDEDEVDQENEKWNRAAILYVVGDSPFFEDMNGVLYSGPHTINNRPIILKVIIGDFKTILEVDDRVGSPVEIRYFSDFFQDMDVSELKSVGRTYTWTNSHSKAIVNAEWKQKFTHLEAEVMNLGCSDHSPIAIMLDEKRSIGG
ncbi:hypothetical protein FXO38_25604 [Capsicum annuum]|nr:hypothetical protein FXO38_25604 [Capsicum annuum]